MDGEYSDSEPRKSADTYAVEYKTVPQYIYIDDESGDVMSLQDVIAANSGNIDFDAFYESYGDKFPNVDKLEMLKLWISANDSLSDQMMMYYVQTSVGALLDVQNFITYDLERFRKDVDSAISKFLARAEKMSMAKALLTERIPNTKFISRSKTYTETSSVRIPLEVVFDKFTPSQRIPFAVFGGMYKYATWFTPPSSAEWIDDVSKKALTLKRESETGLSNVFIRLTETGTEIELSMALDENVDDVLSDVHESIGQTLYDRQITQQGVQGIYYFIGYMYDYTTLADFIMNNEIVSQQYSLGEFTRASPTRNAAATRIYNTELEVTGVISSRHMESTGEDSRNMHGMISVGDPYIRVFISSARTDEVADHFIKSLGQILNTYYMEYESIYNVYSSYIPHLRTVDLTRKYTVPEESQDDDELFVANYSRVCANVPTRVPEGETVEHSIEFPRGSGNMYTCTDEVYKYPGVRVNNKLSNADKFPFIPCCYKEPQAGKPKFKQYYESAADVQPKQIRMITTDKVLRKNFFGVLPPRVATLLESIELDTAFVRFSAGTGPSAFLDCLNKATRRSVSRNDLVTLSDPVLCTQENPGVSLTKISQILAGDTYLDPRYFIKALESVFGVNIYIFDADGIVIPNHVHGYCTYVHDQRRPTVLVFVHKYADACELISAWDTSTNVYTHIYAPDARISTDTVKIFNYMNKHFAGKTRVSPIVVPSYIQDAVSQYVDMYGKTRGVLLSIDNTNVYVDVTPIPPLSLPLTERVYDNDTGAHAKFTDRYNEYLDKMVGGVTTTLPTGNTSALETAISTREMAKQLMEAIQFIFSKWHRDTQSLNVAEFINDMVAVNPDTEYVHIGPETADIERLMRSGKIVFKTEETVERLMFVLRHAIERNRVKLDTYWSHTYFDNYYTSIESFRSGDFILVPSIDTSDKDDLRVSTVIKPDSDDYLMEFKNNVYRARLIDSLPNNANVYVYNGKDDIVHVGGSTPLVLVYKYMGVTYYLKLSKIS